MHNLIQTNLAYQAELYCGSTIYDLNDQIEL